MTSQAGTEANAPIDCSDAPLDSTEMESSAEPDDGEDPVSSDASGEVSVVAPPVVSDVATETEPPSSLPAASADPGESAEESAGESAAPARNFHRQSARLLFYSAQLFQATRA